MLGLLIFFQLCLLRAMKKPQEEIDIFLRQRRGADPYPAFIGTKVLRLQKWSVFLLCLLSILCVRISMLQAQEESLKAWEAQCLEHFTEIMEVQKFRQMLQYGADEMIRRYERGELDKKSLDSTLAVWHNTESRLREKVTKIYDTAYAEKCFENESKRTERRDAP
jgi:hypothetical protein